MHQKKYTFMKKSFMLLLAALLFSGIVFGQQKKVAIISVFFDKNVSGSLTEDMIEKISVDPHFNFDNLATDFKDRLFSKYVQELPVDLIPEDQVITRDGYSDLTSVDMGSFWYKRMALPEGYVFIDSRPLIKDAGSIQKAFDIIEGVDAVMICYVDFNLGSGVGGNTLGGNKIMAYANFKIFDKNGKKIMAIRESAQSKGMMMNALGGSVYKPEKLQELSAEALEELYEDLDKKLAKNSAKVEKKLNAL